MAETPLVSVCCVAYNHERYVAEALDSFLAQRAPFPFEVVVHDDASTDRTAEIIRAYQQKYPETIKPILQAENQYGRGRRIFPIVFARARGKYVAMCEADDFWTDPEKLRKQVEMLEARPDFPLCFHPADRLDDRTGERISRFFRPPVIKESYTTDDLLEHRSFIPTCGVLMRAGLFEHSADWFYPTLHDGNFALFSAASQLGPLGYLDEPMAVYRCHSSGTYNSQGHAGQFELQARTYEAIGERLGVRGRESFRKGLAKVYLELHNAYTSEGRWPDAARALWRALLVAPLRWKPYVAKLLGLRLPAAYLRERYL